MSNQEILNWLSILECQLFYAQRDIPGAAAVHDSVRDALEGWSRATGCTIQGGPEA